MKVVYFHIVYLFFFSGFWVWQISECSRGVFRIKLKNSWQLGAHLRWRKETLPYIRIRKDFERPAKRRCTMCCVSSGSNKAEPKKITTIHKSKIERSDFTGGRSAGGGQCPKIHRYTKNNIKKYIQNIKYILNIIYSIYNISNIKYTVSNI